METYHKYFVSQHFGKSIATVELGKTSGSVTLALTRPQERNVTFTFQLSRLAQFVRDSDQYPNMATRIAVQQAHKLMVHDGLAAFDGASLPLALETPPWIGDLTDAPYGGATAGYENFMAAATAGNAALRPA